VHDLRLLRNLMRTVRCLLANRHLRVELYLQHLLPAVLTCVVGKRLCAAPPKGDLAAAAATGDGGGGRGGGPGAGGAGGGAGAAGGRGHWALRDEAASLVARVCRTFGPRYGNLQPRITKTLCRALMDPKKPLTTKYGAIVGIDALGAPAVEVLLLPVLPNVAGMLEEAARHERAALAAQQGGGAAAGKKPTAAVTAVRRRVEAQFCYSAALRALATYFAGVAANAPAVVADGDKDAANGAAASGGLASFAVKEDAPKEEEGAAPFRWGDACHPDGCTRLTVEAPRPKAKKGKGNGKEDGGAGDAAAASAAPVSPLGAAFGEAMLPYTMQGNVLRLGCGQSSTLLSDMFL